MKSDVSRVGVDVCDHAFLTGRLCRPLLKTPMFSLFPSFTTSVSPNVFKGFTGLTTKIPNTSNGVHGFTAPDPQIPPLRSSSFMVQCRGPRTRCLESGVCVLVFGVRLPGKIRQASASLGKKRIFSDRVGVEHVGVGSLQPFAFSLLPLLRCHAYILTMVRLLARLEN